MTISPKSAGHEMPLIDLRSPTPGSANATTFGATVLSDTETAKTCAASPILLGR
jgi:hypothetical protein